MDGRSDATTLPDHSIDLIVAGQAIHWFEPHSTLKEFRRILKPEGWLAVLFHTRIDYEIFEALKPVFSEDNGWDTTPSPKPQYGDSHTDYYFGIDSGIKMHFPQTWQESWEEFIGGILSNSHSPDDTHPAFQRFVSAVRQVYDQFTDGGSLQVLGGTDLVLGQLRKDVSLMVIAITREVSPAMENCELTHLSRQPIDIDLACRQHQEYEEALKMLGCQVQRLPAEPDLPNSVFVEDAAVVLDEIAIITRPGAVWQKT